MVAKRKRSYRKAKPVKSIRRRPKKKPRTVFTKKQKAIFYHLLDGGSTDDLPDQD